MHFLLKLRRLFENGLPPPQPCRNSLKRFVPRLEQFEDRVAPAAIYTWTGEAQLPPSLDWSDARNWRDEAQVHGVPGPDDTAKFINNGKNSSFVDLLYPGVVGKVILDNPSLMLTLQRELRVTTTEHFWGTVMGSSTYLVPAGGTYQWTGGTLRGFGYSVTQISAQATMTIKGSTFVELEGRTISNAGTVRWQEGADIFIYDNGVFDNVAGAQFIDENTALTPSISGGSMGVDFSGKFNVTGATYTKTGNVITEIATRFTSDGATTDIQTGTLRLMNGPQHAIKNSSTFTVANPAALTFWGAVTVEGSNTLSGQGYVYHAGSTVTIASGGTLTVSRYVLRDDGKIEGAGTFEVNGVMNWYNGEMSGAGTTRVLPNRTLNIVDSGSGAGLATLKRTLQNDGTIIISGSGTLTLDGGTLENRTDAILDIRNDRTIGAMGMASINNQGIFKKSQGAGTATVQPNFSTSGTLIAAAGTLAFSSSVTQSAGQTQLSGGNLDFNGDFTIQAGSSLTGGGTIAASSVVNSGTITISTDGQGTLRIAKRNGMGGKYRQTASGTLNMKIAGDAIYDWLNVEGEVDLAGTLAVSLVGGYAPAQARTYTLLSFESRPNPDTNKFTTHNLPSPSWSVAYGNISMTTTHTP